MKTPLKITLMALLISGYANAQWTIASPNVETTYNIKLPTNRKLIWDTERAIEINNTLYGTNTDVMKFSSKGTGFDFTTAGKSTLRIADERVGINAWSGSTANRVSPKSLLHLSTAFEHFDGGILLDQNVPWASKFSVTNTCMAGHAFFSINDVTSLVDPAASGSNFTVMKNMGDVLSRTNNDVMKTISRISINREGLVGIGTIYPDAKLTVKGDVHSEEVRVDLLVPADYVFQKYYTGTSDLNSDYTMPTLEEIEKFTKDNHHLPGVPSAQQIKEEGLKLGEMANIMLQKVEELTLYNIEMQKQIKAQQLEINELKKQSK